MRVEITERVERDATVASLASRYGGLDSLRHRVSKDPCSEPDGADDYVVWTAFQEDGVVEDRTVFDTPDVFRALTPRRMELLEHLRGDGVRSIRELASRLRRDYKNTYDDLVALRQWGLVELRREGRNRRPVTRVADLRVTWDG